MTDLFAATRTVVKSRYALIAPDAFVPSIVPGWKNAAVVVNISPAMRGARFTQLHVTLDREGEAEGNTGVNQYFIYVIEGTGSILLANKRHRLEAGSYIYLPPSTDLQIKSGGAAFRLLVFQKKFQPLKGAPPLATIVAHEREVKEQPLPGSQNASVQALLPEQPEFDMAVSILTYQPGASLPSVQSQVMERGVLMLNGRGTVRLGDDKYPVKAGDVIWTAAFCPYWFAALSEVPASYIQYGDVNREPM